MCNKQSNVELHSLKVELQETTSDISSASLKTPIASFQSSEIVKSEVSASLQESETAVLPSPPNCLPTITDKNVNRSSLEGELLRTANYQGADGLSNRLHTSSQPQVKCILNQASHEHQSSPMWRTSAIQFSAMLQNAKFQGTTMNNAALVSPLPGSTVSSTHHVQVRSRFLSNNSLLKNGVNYDLYPSKYSGNPSRQLREPIEQSRMTVTVATGKQNSLSKPASSSFNTAAAIDEINAQKSTTMPPWAFEQAVQKNVGDPISCAEPPSKKQELMSVEEAMNQINDIVSTSGVDVREELKKMFPELMVERQPSGREKGGRLFLEKKPLRNKVVTLAKNWGVSFVNEDVELCLSLSLEEWFRSILNRLIMFSDQRQDMVEGNQQVLVTSDVGAQIRMLRRKAREASEAKHRAERKEAGNQNEKVTEGQEEPNLKSQKGRKVKKKVKEVGALRTGETNEMLLKWEIMAEQARLKRESEAGTQGQENRATRLLSIQKKPELGTTTLLAVDSGRPPGSNPHAQPQKCITVNDLISVLELDPCMARSTILYQFYERAQKKLQPK